MVERAQELYENVIAHLHMHYGFEKPTVLKLHLKMGTGKFDKFVGNFDVAIFPLFHTSFIEG